MRIEGQKPKAPFPRSIPLQSADIRAVVHASQKLHRYQSSPGAWRQGLRGELVLEELGLVISKQERPVIVGKIGECALRWFLYSHFGDAVPEIDFERRVAGDDGNDLVVFGYKMQVKARTKITESLVRRTTTNGRISIPLCGDAHVFTQWLCDHESRRWSADLLGWLPNRFIVPMPLMPARRGEHFNSEISDTDLLPMKSLLAELRSRKETAVLQ